MTVGFGEISRLLAAMHEGVPDRTISARLKYFQRLSFPTAGLAVGKGWRAAYSAGDVVAVTIAFDLLSVGVPPASAAFLVRQSWDDLEWTARAAWLERATRRHALPMLVSLNGLGGRGRAAGEVDAGTTDGLRRWLEGTGDLRGFVIVDVMRSVRSLSAAVHAALPGERPAEASRLLDAWAAATEATRTAVGDAADRPGSRS